MPRAFRIERPPGVPGGDLAIYVDDFCYLTLHYDYRYTSNAGQYSFAEQLVRGWVRAGDSLTIDGKQVI